MGVFQNLFKKNAKKPTDKVEETDCGTDNAADSDTASKDYALSPPKASREIKETLYDNDNGKYVDIEYSFLLSGDFVDSYTNAGEIDYLAVYAPECEEEFCPYDIGSSAFIVSSAPENEIYDIIDKYKYSGTPDGVYSFERVSGISPNVYFRACTLVRGLVLYFYAIDRGLSYTKNYIGVMYDPKLRNTPLEQKMMKEVDEAVESYKENVPA